MDFLAADTREKTKDFLSILWFFCIFLCFNGDYDMRFTVNSDILEKLLAKVIPAVPPRTPVQILENFLFDIRENQLTVTGTDMDLFIQSSIPVDADGRFTAVIPAKLFYELIRTLKDTQIQFEATEGNSLQMKTESGKYEIGFASPEEYPELPEVPLKSEFSISGKLLRRAIEQTQFAASRESMRAAMNGLLLDLTEDGLKFVATDGHRLVRFIYKQLQFDEPEQIIVPIKTLEALLKFLGEDEVTLRYSGTNLEFDLLNIKLITNLINQRYPAYNNVIPLENENFLTVETAPLLAAVKRMLLFDTKGFPKVKLLVDEDRVEVSSEDHEKGSRGQETISCDYKGKSMDIGFNTQFLSDMLSHVEGDKLMFRLDSPFRAAIMECTEAKEGEDLLMLLMPVRLNA
jgi:DNA polymerase-3 subunit beta